MKNHPRRKTTLARVAATIALSILGSLALAAPADAHARLLRSDPRDKAISGSAPKTVDLWFNELLDEDFNGIEVFAATDAAGQERNLATSPARVDPEDRTHLSAPLPALPAGRYVVHWKVLSRDGHSARGRLEFAVVGDRAGGY